jgi:hypothetical protein
MVKTYQQEAKDLGGLFIKKNIQRGPRLSQGKGILNLLEAGSS